MLTPLKVRSFPLHTDVRNSEDGIALSDNTPAPGIRCDGKCRTSYDQVSEQRCGKS
jgi:hypothetical protein